MLQDSCTWDADYNQGVVEPIRRELVRLATGPEYESDYSAVLLQGVAAMWWRACWARR